MENNYSRGKVMKKFIFILFYTSFLLNSCALYDKYMDLREEPVYKDGVVLVSPPETFSAISGDSSTGCITLEWPLVKDAVSYEIYYTKDLYWYARDDSPEEIATYAYTYTKEYKEGEIACLEVSQMSKSYYCFYVRSIFASGSKSKFCKEYVETRSTSSNATGVLSFKAIK